MTYSGASIALEDVLAVLGVADADLLFETLEAVAAHDPRRALLSAAKLSESGHARRIVLALTRNRAAISPMARPSSSRMRRASAR